MKVTTKWSISIISLILHLWTDLFQQWWQKQCLQGIAIHSLIGKKQISHYQNSYVIELINKMLPYIATSTLSSTDFVVIRITKSLWQPWTVYDAMCMYIDNINITQTFRNLYSSIFTRFHWIPHPIFHKWFLRPIIFP